MSGEIAIGVGIAVLTAGGLALARVAFVEAYGSDEVDYRGETIRLAKKYVDYDDYKKDPGNVASSEIPRVEKMMSEAHIGPNFATGKDFVDQAFTIKFPGYGTGPKVVAAGREFIVEVIEIPRVSKDRYFVLEKMIHGTFRLVDDFVTLHGPRSAYWRYRLSVSSMAGWPTPTARRASFAIAGAWFPPKIARGLEIA